MKRNGVFITDGLERVLILRGINVGGSSKIPAGVTDMENGAPDGKISFTGRPFPGEEAEEHFGRLKEAGFDFVRLVITWEALEHAGPGIYDEAYLAYLRKLLLAAEKKGISACVDPHQDVWSRCTGGDGAPSWTLEKLGIIPERLGVAGAARYSAPRNRSVIWPVNYSLYGAATMFTLFFAGNAFAPELTIEGESAQDWLQERYIAAFRHCFRRLKNCKAVSAWGVMNEAHPGFIGYGDLAGLENATLASGPVPSPFEAMIAASGRPVEVPVYTPWLKGWKVTGKKVINPEGISIFREGFGCPWKRAGIWDDGKDGAVLRRPAHFAARNDRPVRFADDFLKPFQLRFIERMNGADRPALFFIEGVPHGEKPRWRKEDPQNTVNAFHHYDGFTLFTKHYKPWLTVDPLSGGIILGRKNGAAHYSAKLAAEKAWAREQMDDMPCVLGEFGLPFDLNRGEAFKTGDYRIHEDALSRYYDGIDKNLLGSCLWNYTSDNTSSGGDHWNGEDFSIYSETGFRAEGGWLRPYPAATAGTPLEFRWNRKKAVFFFRFLARGDIAAPTEIFLPARWFGENPRIVTAGRKTGLRSEYSRNEQRLRVYNDGYDGEAELTVYAGPPHEGGKSLSAPAARED